MKHTPIVFRVALVGAVVMGALVSCTALQSARVPTQAVQEEAGTGLRWLAGLTAHSKAHEAALKASTRATFTAMASLGSLRRVIALALSFTACMVCAGAIFMRMSMRMKMARLVGTMAFATAFLRTLQGAYELIIAQRAAKAGIQVLVAADVPQASEGAELTVWMVSTFSIVWTLVVVGTFMLLGSYWRSPAVSQLLED